MPALLPLTAIDTIAEAPDTFDEFLANPWRTAYVDGTYTMDAHHPANRRAAWSMAFECESAHAGDAAATLAPAIVGPVSSPIP